MFIEDGENESVSKAYNKAEELRAQRLSSALSRVGQTEEGRLVLWHIIFDICKINEDAMGGEEVVYRHMGRRSAGLRLLTEIEQADVAIHLNMIKDNKSRSESERLLLEQILKEGEEENGY